MLRKFMCLFALGCAPLFAQAGVYPLAIDQDKLSGAVDFSFLNHPLGPEDRLTVSGGRFVRAGGGERVRLFGVNLSFGANFPTEADAPRIARRLAKLGVNLVRLHHMDSQPDSNPSNAGSILTTGPYPSLNNVAVARLRAFLDALRAEGVYANLNLHVGYQFRPAVDGVPGPVPSQSKPLHRFHPRMVELQKDYTGRLLDALSLAGDPVLAMVEIDNETSLLEAWQNSSLDRSLDANTGGEYRREMARQWNVFLAEKYATTEAIEAAWGSGTPDGAELLTAAGWRSEIHAPAQASFQVLPLDGIPTVRTTVTAGGAPVIMKQVGFSISLDKPYLAEIEIRADLPDGVSRTIYWDVKQDVTPWRTMSNQFVEVTNRWRKVSMPVTPVFAMDGIGRFGVSVENITGVVYIRNWTLRETGRRGLQAGERIEERGISLPATAETPTEARLNDYVLFLAARDRAYLSEILGVVREKTGPLTPVAGTQMNYGGLLNLDSQQDLDYQDNHFYVDHYGFPGVAWDSRDWYIRDQSNIGAGLTTFETLAASREAGRPYTVSEYNQPWPNSYGAEIAPTLAAFAAHQDWDSIMHFAYSHGRGWDDGVPNGFNINGDWTKFPGLGQAAWLFRTGAVSAGTEPVEIPVSRALRLRAARERRNGAIAGFLTAAAGYNPALAFVHPIRIARDEDAPMPPSARAPAASPFLSDTGEILYDRTQRLYRIQSPRAAGVFGFVSGKKITAGALDVEAPQFVSVLLTPLDGAPIADSRRLLLTTPGYTLRSQPAVTPPRPQRLVNYGNTSDRWTLEREPAFANKPSGNRDAGVQPVWMERVESFVTIRTSASALTVYPLDGAGNRLDPLTASDLERADGGFRLHLQADGQAFAPWYEILGEP